MRKFKAIIIDPETQARARLKGAARGVDTFWGNQCDVEFRSGTLSA